MKVLWGKVPDNKVRIGVTGRGEQSPKSVRIIFGRQAIDDLNLRDAKFVEWGLKDDFELVLRVSDEHVTARKLSWSRHFGCYVQFAASDLGINATAEARDFDFEVHDKGTPSPFLAVGFLIYPDLGGGS